MHTAVLGLRNNPGLVDGVVPVGLTGLVVTVDVDNPAASDCRVVDNPANAEGLLAPLLAECREQGLEVWGALGGVPALWTYPKAEPNYPWIKDPRSNYFVIDPRDPAFPGVIERLARSAADIAAAHNLVGYVFNDESAWFKPRKTDPDMHYYQDFLDALANALHARGLKLSATIAVMDEIGETTEDVRRRMAVSPVDCFPAMDTYYGDFMHFQDRVSYYAPSMRNYAPAFFPSSQELTIERARAQFQYMSEDALTGGNCPTEVWLWVLPELFSEPDCLAFLLALYEWKLGSSRQSRTGFTAAVDGADGNRGHADLKQHLRMLELKRVVQAGVAAIARHKKVGGRVVDDRSDIGGWAHSAKRWPYAGEQEHATSGRPSGGQPYRDKACRKMQAVVRGGNGDSGSGGGGSSGGEPESSAGCCGCSPLARLTDILCLRWLWIWRRQVEHAAL